MSKPFRFGSAISFVALATAIVGCAAPQKATGFGGKANGNVGLATRALMALNANDVPTAIDFAERAVAALGERFEASSQLLLITGEDG